MSTDSPAPAAQPQATPPQAAQPRILDRSYRGYEGELKTRAARWWIVALATIRAGIRKPGFWALAGLVALVYVINGLLLYFTKDLAARVGAALGGEGNNPYAQTLDQCLNGSGLLLFTVALVVGVGSIAADNRANALLVYLSKPITRTDYLLGKWAGVFLLLAFVSWTPAFLLYLFFLAAYTDDGFLRQNPLLILRMTNATLLPAALHASLIIGFSAWSRSPRLAGALYAGLYFVLGTLVGITGNVLLHNAAPDEDAALATRAAIVRSLSVQGVIEGVGMHLYGIDPERAGSQLFGRPGRDGPFGMPVRTRPPLAPLLLFGGVLIVVPLLAARAKIRAVEVVSG